MAAFERSVFINCPFDPDYRPFVLPLVFTVLYLGLRPRIAYEDSDSGDLRLLKILRLIKASKFSIHDLSRCRAARRGEYYRLNMPLELGIDAGFRWSGGCWARKRFLILEGERYSYQKALSDLAGADLKCHENNFAIVIEIVRNWLVQMAGAPAVPPSRIRSNFEDFQEDNFERLVAARYSRREIEKLPVNEVFEAMNNWVRKARLQEALED